MNRKRRWMYGLLVMLGLGLTGATCEQKMQVGSTDDGGGGTADARNSADTRVDMGGTDEEPDSEGTDAGRGADVGVDSGAAETGLADTGTVEETDGTDDTTGGTSKLGEITVVQYRDWQPGPSEWSPRVIVGGHFYIGERSTLNDECDVTRGNNGCRLETCPKDASADSGDPTYRSAGEVRVKGGDLDIQMTQDERGFYSFQSNYDAEYLYRDDQELTFEATGGDVPEFSADLRPEFDLDGLTEPELPTGDEPLVIEADSDLSVAWNTETLERGQFVFRLSSKTDSTRTNLVCLWDVSAGSGTVPASLMEGHEVRKSGSGAYTAEITNSTEVQAGEYDVEITTVSPVGDGDGKTVRDGKGDAVFNF